MRIAAVPGRQGRRGRMIAAAAIIAGLLAAPLPSVAQVASEPGLRVVGVQSIDDGVAVLIAAPAFRDGARLTSEAVQVTQDGERLPVRVESFGADQLEIALVVDPQDSGELLARAQAAVVEFVLATLPDARILVMGPGFTVDATPSSDPAAALRSLQGLQPDARVDADTLRSALQQLELTDRGRTALVVIGDARTMAVLAEVGDQLAASDATPYAVVAGQAPTAAVDAVEASGGDVTTVSPTADLLPALERVAAELASHRRVEVAGAVPDHPLRLSVQAGDLNASTTIVFAANEATSAAPALTSTAVDWLRRWLPAVVLVALVIAGLAFASAKRQRRARVGVVTGRVSGAQRPPRGDGGAVLGSLSIRILASNAQQSLDRVLPAVRAGQDGAARELLLLREAVASVALDGHDVTFLSALTTQEPTDESPAITAVRRYAAALRQSATDSWDGVVSYRQLMAWYERMTGETPSALEPITGPDRPDLSSEDSRLGTIVLRHARLERLTLGEASRLARLVTAASVARSAGLPPIIAISAQLREHRERYGEARERGELDSWLQLLLQAIELEAERTTQMVQELHRLREEFVATIGPGSAVERALTLLLARPALTVRLVASRLGMEGRGAMAAIRELERHGILESRGRQAPGGRKQWIAPRVLAAIGEPLA